MVKFSIASLEILEHSINVNKRGLPSQVNNERESITCNYGQLLMFYYELDCKTVGFFLKISKASLPSLALCFQPCSIRDLLFDCSAHLNTQKYGLFCSLITNV